MKYYLLIFIYFFMVNQTYSQDNLIQTLLESKPEHFEKILSSPNKYEVQIAYTQINRTKKNKPKFKTHLFQVDKNHYFYPASTVKLPACLLALEKINNLRINGFNKNSDMITFAAGHGQTAVSEDTTSESGLPSIAHYIKKILMVSDNDAFNRLFEFIGQKNFNETLWKKGYKDLRIVHRLQSGNTPEENQHSNPITFYECDELVYKQDSAYNPKTYWPEQQIKKGIGYLDANNKLINEPLDFTKRNFFSIQDQHNILKNLMFPEVAKKKSKFNLTAEDYDFIYQYMSQLPTQSKSPIYDKAEFFPTYCKFLMYGSEPKAQIPNNIKIFNKVGDAYGFLLDNAYIVDFENNVEFLVSVIIHCNDDQIYNDDKYDYDTIGLPFMKNLGQLIYNYELKRAKKVKPNLSKFKMEYDN